MIEYHMLVMNSVPSVNAACHCESQLYRNGNITYTWYISVPKFIHQPCLSWRAIVWVVVLRCFAAHF